MCFEGSQVFAFGHQDVDWTFTSVGTLAFNLPTFEVVYDY